MSRASRAAFGCLVLATTGCYSPVDAVFYDYDSDQGHYAENAGHLEEARSFYWRAYVNANAGHLGPKAESNALYNYGRIAGLLCDFEHARKSLEGALELEERAEGPNGGLSGNRMFELARLNLDHAKYAEAVYWYDRAIPLARKSGFDRGSGDPIGFANELDRYASALEQTGDSARAAELRAESAKLHELHPGAEAYYVYDHYPSDCGPS
jgi:tetratricopeptide (TPR) repeat protein